MDYIAILGDGQWFSYPVEAIPDGLMTTAMNPIEHGMQRAQRAEEKKGRGDLGTVGWKWDAFSVPNRKFTSMEYDHIRG